ncbi:hypothetical protein QR680_002616 [Steinernema hermaphroditum]|uniref:Uncharacterized protein n=1 Tax=Steinernema hermaphroditum TaxID=289476 RepID=A0AA39H551_9BILA|nr:hypothetical protein QR680_002616 [Steinernema hermaphroditum]
MARRDDALLSHPAYDALSICVTRCLLEIEELLPDRRTNAPEDGLALFVGLSATFVCPDMDPLHVVAFRLAEIKVETGSRHDLRTVLIEAEKILLDGTADAFPEMAYLRTLSVSSSLPSAVKQALDNRDYRAATALALINRPVWSQRRLDDVERENGQFEKICAHIAVHQWIEVIQLWPLSNWFHLLLLLLDNVSASQMSVACAFLAEIMSSEYAVIPAVISGNCGLLEDMDESGLVEFMSYYKEDDMTDNDSDTTEDADEDDSEHIYFEENNELSQQDQYCVNVWLNFVDVLNKGFAESVLTQWRHYGITTTIENVLIPLLERHMLTDATLSAFYELTSEVQKGHFQSCREMFAKLASTSDFAHVTTFLPALRRAVAIAADTLPSSRSNS